MDEKKLITLFIILMITFTFGYLLGRGSVKQSYMPVQNGAMEPAEKKPGLFSAPKAQSSRVSADGVAMLCDFENERAIDMWKTRGARVELSNEHVSEGAGSAKVQMFGGGGISAVMIEDYFEGRGATDDWSGYEMVSFDVYNDQPRELRLILQLKDSNDGRYKKDIFVDGKKTKTVKIYIDALSGVLKTSAIRQFNIFRWQPKDDVEIYLDNLRLIPKNYKETSMIQDAGSRPLGAEAQEAEVQIASAAQPVEEAVKKKPLNRVM